MANSAIGTLNNLQTNTKESLIDAINEVNQDFTNVKSKVEDLTTNLAQSNAITNRQPHEITSTKATIIMDDGYIWDHSILKPLFDSYGIRAACALISVFVDANKNVANPTRYMNMAMINSLRNAGWEMLAHTKDHLDLSTLTYEKQEEQLKECYDKLKSLGIETECVVYPLNNYNADTLEISRKYYKAAFALDKTWKYYHNKAPINQYAIHRIVLEGEPNNFKILADRAVAENGWIVLMGHGFNYASGDTQYNSNALAYTKANIEYLQSKGIEFILPSEGLQIYGNAITIGDDLLSTNKFKIGADGKIDSNQLLPTKIMDGGITIDTPYTFFEPNSLTITTVLFSDNAGFPTGAGTVKTYRFGTRRNEFVTQIFEPYDDNKQYVRKWVYNNNAWTSFATPLTPSQLGQAAYQQYSTGVWTPTLYGGDATFTSSGHFVVIGKMIHISGQISVTTKSTTNVGVTIAGLPYSAKLTNPTLLNVKILNVDTGVDAIGQISSPLSNGIKVLQSAGKIASDYVASDSLKVGSVIQFSGTYQIAD